MANNTSFEMSMCFQDPQSEAIKAFESSDSIRFKAAITQGADLDRLDNTKISIFHRACQTSKYSQFIKICLQNGCDVNKINPELKKYPIHFAVDSQDPDNLFELLDHRPNINVQFENQTAILQSTQLLKEDNFEQIFACIKLLVKHQADVNLFNHKNVTPIIILAKSKVSRVSEIIKYLLNNCNVDLDTQRDGEARRLLQKKFPDISLPVIVKDDIARNIDFNYLKSLLKEHKEDKFINNLNNFMISTENINNRENVFIEDLDDGNLLQIAVEECLTRCVKRILEHGANPNHHTSKYSAIAIACQKGNTEILKCLLGHKDINLRARADNPPLLTILVKKLGETRRNHCSFNECFDLLINKVDVNEVDSSCSTALHYAVRYKNKYAIESLLQNGAYIGTKNKLNDLPITDINPIVLENYFDSCIETNQKRPGDDDFEIIFNYKSLVPTKVRNKHKNGIETPCSVLTEYAEEMLPIDYMTKTPELRRLVKHPLISSFLWLKWNRLGSIFYTNFALYSIFCISMIMYLVFCYGHDTSEWLATILYTISVIGVFYVIIREIIQFLMLSWSYFSLIENYIEIALVLITMLVLSAAEFEESYRRMLAAIAILLAAAEFSLLVGSLPVMSISTHMVMLKTVSISFMRSLVLYSIIIVSFALCFYTLLGGDSDVTDEEEKFNAFVDPGTAIIKTIVMFTGEFEAASINFGTNKTTYFVFVLFVFFISIVLLNLLNGLAVSDTQVIKSEAELTGFIYRANLLTRYEKMMLGRTNTNCSNQLCRNWLVRKCSGSLISIFPKFLPKAKLILKPNENRKVYLDRPKTELLDVRGSLQNLNSIDSEHEKYDQIPLVPSGIFCCLCKTTQIDRKILKYSQSVIESKDQKLELEKEKEEMEKRLLRIEETMLRIEYVVHEIRNNHKQ